MSGASPRKALFKGALLCALMFLELLALQLRLDQTLILDSPRWWAKALWYYPTFFNVALLCMGAMAVMTRREIGKAAQTWRLEGNSSTSRYLAAHILLIAFFYALSVFGFQGGAAAAAGVGADLWFASWFGCGLLAVVAWLCALVPPTRWAAFLRGGSRGLLWGMALGCALWLSGQFLAERLFTVGREPTLMAVATILSAAGHEASYTIDPARIRIEGFGVRMSAACFGYEGIALVLVFCAVYLVAVRKELAFPRSFVLVPLAVFASWTLNVLRVSVLILIGAYEGLDAIEGFHSVAGWLYFAAIAAGIVLLSQQRWFARNQEQAPVAERTANPAAPYLLPLLVVLATAMVTRVFTSDFDFLYPLRAVFVGAVLLLYRRQIRELGWRGSTWAVTPGAMIFLGWMALEPSPSPSPIATGLAQLPGWAAVLWLAFRVFGSSLTVPLAEELAFRGYVIRKLTASNFESVPDGRASWFALAFSSILFGMMHGRFLAGTLAGVALALTLSRRGRLADAVVAHATANALIAAYAVSTQHWSVWD